jgi:microcystin-dependent protein
MIRIFNSVKIVYTIPLVYTMVNWIRIGTSNTPDTLPPLDQSANSISINATGIYQAPREGQLIIKPLRDNKSNYDTDASGAVLLGYTTPSGEVVQVGWLPEGSGSTGGSTGMIIPFAGTPAPEGWLLCDGADVSTTTYAALFAVIHTTYGTAGPGTFRVPDLRGRTIFGAAVGGQATIADPAGDDVLGQPHMPQHNHGGVAHRHTFEHEHHWSTYNPDIYDAGATGIAGGSGPYETMPASALGTTVISATTPSGASTGWDPLVYPNDTTQTTDQQLWNADGGEGGGGGGGDPFLSPTVVINYIIKK